MNNRTLISLGVGLGVAAVVALFFAILTVGTRSTAQQVPPAATADTAAPAAPGGAGKVPIILVVDRSAILRQSAAGKDLIKQIDDMRKQLEGKYGPEEKKLRDDAQALQEQAGVLSPDARQKKERELRERGEALQRKVQDEQASIQNGINIAQQQIEKTAWPILNQLFSEHGATLLLDRNSVVLGSVDIDITAQVIQRLDQTLPAVKVVPKKPDTDANGQPKAEGQ